MNTFSCTKVGLDFFDDAPTVHRVSREISASPEDVFAAFLDAEAWVRWAPPITRVEWTSEFPLAAGSTRTVHMWGGLVGFEEFLAYDHGTRMAFRFNEASKPGVVAFAEDYQVTDLGRGRVRVDWAMAMDTGRTGPADKLVNPLMRLGLAYMLRRFGKHVERRAKAGAVR